MITANWPEIIGTLLLVAGGIGTAVAGYRRFRTPSKPAPGRSADAGPPPGAVEWVLDIEFAMGLSHASCILEALTDGCCRDQARARRIEHLEATPWARSQMVAEAKSQMVADAPPAQEPQA